MRSSQSSTWLERPQENGEDSGRLPNKALHLTVGRRRPPAGERQTVGRTHGDLLSVPEAECESGLKAVYF